MQRDLHSRRGTFYVEPMVVLLIATIFAFIAWPTYLSMRGEALLGNTGKILASVRSGIAFQKARTLVTCNAALDEELTTEQIARNDVTAAGSCKGKELSEEERRFIASARIPANPYNDNTSIMNCSEWPSPCDFKSLGEAALEYAGWCFDPKTQRFWAASNKAHECSL